MVLQINQDNKVYIPIGLMYICEFIQVLQRSHNRLYTIQKKAYCLNCVNYGKCTKSKSGRKLERLAEEELKRRMEQSYVLPENKAIYKRRQAKIELVFGHFKKNLGMNCFLLRGVAGARAEISLLSICFNIRRMITLLGQKGLIRQFKELSISYQGLFSASKNILNCLFTNQMIYLN